MNQQDFFKSLAVSSKQVHFLITKQGKQDLAGTLKTREEIERLCASPYNV